jgi:hypothetical protein
MNDKEFIDIQKRPHIDKLLLETKREKGNLQIWQRDIRVRVRAHGYLTKIDNDGKYLDLISKEHDGFGDFSDGDIYFYAEHRKVIFKSRVLRLGAGKIRIEFPDLVKIEDARCEPRVRYGLQSYQTMDIMTLSKENQKFPINDLKLVDSSKDGVGFLIRLKPGANLQVGSKIVTTRSTIENVEGRTGIIRSIIKQSNDLSGEKLLRVGVELF